MSTHLDSANAPAPVPASDASPLCASSLGQSRHLGYRGAILFGVGAVLSFQLAFIFPTLAWLVLSYLGCLFELRRLPTPRRAFYAGLLIGLGIFVPHLLFLWDIFGTAAIPLWLILALFHAIFLLILNRVQARLGTRWAVLLAPVLWCGIEYFRSEVWWLRFSWFTAGTTLGAKEAAWLHALGVYGASAVLMALAAIYLGLVLPGLNWRQRALSGGIVIVMIGLFWPTITIVTAPRPSARIEVAGAQLEFPGVPEVIVGLNRLMEAHPEAQLILLSEYTFDGPVPPQVKTWCQKHGKWLVVGGKQSITGELGGGAARKSEDRYYNMAFVISPTGEMVFSQAKSRPIQFFRDGEPAREQQVWNSPWAKLGIAICYDVSYRQVMDRLVQQGAQALLIPTMDVEQWGEWQHHLNARMAALRAAEYRLPIFRVASSGISQLIGPRGTEYFTTSFPGPGEFIFGQLDPIQGGGRVPLDSWLAPACTLATGAAVLWLGWITFTDFRNRRRASVAPV